MHDCEELQANAVAGAVGHWATALLTCGKPWSVVSGMQPRTSRAKAEARRGGAAQRAARRGARLLGSAARRGSSAARAQLSAAARRRSAAVRRRRGATARRTRRQATRRGAPRLLLGAGGGAVGTAQQAASSKFTRRACVVSWAAGGKLFVSLVTRMAVGESNVGDRWWFYFSRPAAGGEKMLPHLACGLW